MQTRRVHCGDDVVVHRNAAQRAAERARVVGVRQDARLRLEFPDGHRSICDPDQISRIDTCRP